MQELNSYFLFYVQAFLIIFFFFYLLFTFFPQLIHKKKNLGLVRTYVSQIAHRGSKNEGIPENTKAAFTNAINSGLHVIELDVWLSKDNKVVVFHDHNFTRMTDGANDSLVTDLNYNEFPSISAENKHLDSLDYTKIPLLEDILKITPKNVAMIIEFKQDSDFLIEEVHRLIQACDRYHSTFWFSLEEKINSKLRKFDKNVPTITSIIGMLKVLFLHYLCMLPFVDIEDSVFGITVEEVLLSMLIIH